VPRERVTSLEIQYQNTTRLTFFFEGKESNMHEMNIEVRLIISVLI